MRQRTKLKFFDPQTGAATQETIGTQRPFLHFDLELSESEKLLLQSFDLSLIENGLNPFSYFGKIEDLSSQIQDYLSRLGNNSNENIATVADVMVRLSQHVLSHFEHEHAWICLRPTLPNRAFQQPRWHHDGYFYKPFAGLQAKAVMTLKGPSTLFYEASPEQKEVVRDYEKKAPPLSPRLSRLNDYLEYEKRVRKILADRVFDSAKAVTASYGQGTLFTVGDDGAIHSEPDMKEPRLFFSVLTGTEEQIKELEEKMTAQTRLRLA